METYNTYSKFCPNVYLAKCPEKYDKGETIMVETKYGKENECIVFNLIYSKDGFNYYSIVRADGFNKKEWAKRKAERLQNLALSAESKSESYFNAANEGRDFLSLGEPIKIGHHSEKRHRALIERNHNRIGKAVELLDKSKEYLSRIAYYEKEADKINLSMPECVEFYEYKLEKAKQAHLDLKTGKVKPAHSFSLPYAKKLVNDTQKNLDIAKRLWL